MEPLPTRLHSAALSTDGGVSLGPLLHSGKNRVEKKIKNKKWRTHTDTAEITNKKQTSPFSVQRKCFTRERKVASSFDTAHEKHETSP